MGGFTQIKLKDCSVENIAKQNQLLSEYKVAKKYRFHDLEKEQVEEYKWYLKRKGVFSEHLFPRDKINSLEDFKKYWSPESAGEVFIPPSGTLQFDCYFGRTSKNALHAMGRYVAANLEEFKSFGGSFATFMGRGMSKFERGLVNASGIKYYQNIL